MASPSSYAKCVDVANGTMDEGLYDDGGHLRFYSYGYGLDQPITADYVDIDAEFRLTGRARAAFDRRLAGNPNP